MDSYCDKLLKRISDLEAEVDQLSSENRDIKKSLFFLKNNGLLNKGYEGESFVANILNGTVTNHECSHDVTAPNGARIEIKFSKLTIAVSNRETSKTYRWNWAKVFGDKGNKNYERLILVGEVNKDNMCFYKDKNAPYIIFDIPYSEVMSVATKSSHFYNIGLTSNPATVKSKSNRLLYEVYQITVDQLRTRYQKIKTPYMNVQVTKLGLLPRTLNVLQNAQIITLSDLVSLSASELLRKQNLGRKAVNEIKDVLSSYGLQLPE